MFRLICNTLFFVSITALQSVASGSTNDPSEPIDPVLGNWELVSELNWPDYAPKLIGLKITESGLTLVHEEKPKPEGPEDPNRITMPKTFPTPLQVWRRHENEFHAPGGIANLTSTYTRILKFEVKGDEMIVQFGTLVSTRSIADPFDHKNQTTSRNFSDQKLVFRRVIDQQI